MFLRKSISNGKIYLSFVQGYRDENGKVKQKTVEKLGYLDNLKKDYTDPIVHFKEIAKQKSSKEITELVIKNINTKVIDKNTIQKNLGYSILKKIYNELDISAFLNSKQKNLKINYKLDDVFSLLVFSRILYPTSKKKLIKTKIFILINLIFLKMICIVH